MRKNLYAKSLRLALLSMLALQASLVFAMESGKRRAGEMGRQEGEANNPMEQQNDNPAAAANAVEEVKPAFDDSLTMVNFNEESPFSLCNDEIMLNILIKVIPIDPKDALAFVNALKQLVKLRKICKRFFNFLTPENIRLALDRLGIDPKAIPNDKSDRTALHLAAINGQWCMKILFPEKTVITAVDTVDEYGYTALHHAAINSHPWCIRRLLLANASPNAVQNADTFTALHYAVGHKNATECIKILLGAGANVLIINKYRQTPISYASSLGLTEIVNLFKAYCNAKGITIPDDDDIDKTF